MTSLNITPRDDNGKAALDSISRKLDAFANQWHGKPTYTDGWLCWKLFEDNGTPSHIILAFRRGHAEGDR